MGEEGRSGAEPEIGEEGGDIGRGGGDLVGVVGIGEDGVGGVIEFVGEEGRVDTTELDGDEGLGGGTIFVGGDVLTG